MLKSFLCILTGLSLTMLSGCVGLNSTFDCPKKPGVMCTPLHTIDNKIDDGSLKFDEQDTLVNDDNNVKEVASGDSVYPQLKALQHQPLRYDETIAHVWIGVYEDNDGNYHEPHYLDGVLRPGHWIGKPPVVNQDGEVKKNA